VAAIIAVARIAEIGEEALGLSGMFYLLILFLFREYLPSLIRRFGINRELGDFESVSADRAIQCTIHLITHFNNNKHYI